MKTYSHPVVRKIPLEQVMYALSDPCRIAIVRALAEANGRELACNQIDLKVSKATRSHHFDVLRDSGIVFSRYEGTRCLTSLRIAELDQSFPGLLGLVLHSKRPRSPSQKTLATGSSALMKGFNKRPQRSQRGKAATTIGHCIGVSGCRRIGV
jgi:DNA-binding transcriptional ArsR family regulator